MCIRPALLLASTLLASLPATAGVSLLFDGGSSTGMGSGIEATIRVLANDFELEESGVVESAEFPALVTDDWDGTIEYFFFEHAGNVPADAPLDSGRGMNISQVPTGVTSGPLTEYRFRFDLERPLQLPAGEKFWFGLHLKESFADDGNFAFWSITDFAFGETSRSAAGGDFRSWRLPPDEQAFQLFDEVPEPGRDLQALFGVAALLALRGVRPPVRRDGGPGRSRNPILAAASSSPRHWIRGSVDRREARAMSDLSVIPWIRKHIELYLRDPEKARMWDSSLLGGPGPLPTLLLTATGRKTGKRRPLPLLYGEAGESYVVVASKGGMPQHPSWYLNLEANPECDLMVGAKPVRARARTAQGAERERLWKQMEELYPPYADYQKNAGTRVIPIVVLDPVG